MERSPPEGVKKMVERVTMRTSNSLRMTFAVLFCAAALMLPAASDPYAQAASAPPNDNFANAITIAGDTGVTSGTNVGATRETGEPFHAGGGGGVSVWWKWTPPAPGRWTFDTIGSEFDTVLAVYTGDSVTSLTEISSNDDGATSGTSRLSFEARQGVTYRIAVDGYFSFDTGKIVLNWAPTANAPPNDNFANAQALGGPSGQTTASNTGATKEYGEPNHAENKGGASLWWQWIAPANGLLNVNTSGSLDYDNQPLDTIMAVYTGSRVDQLSQVAANDDADWSKMIYTSSVTFNVQAGETCYIAVDGYAAELGNIILNWKLQEIVAGEIRGTVWEDVDGDGVRETGEEGLAGWTVYLDLNRNGRHDDDEATTVTAADGRYAFRNLAPGTYAVGQDHQEGWHQTYPATGGGPAASYRNLSAALSNITTTGSKIPIHTYSERVLDDPYGIRPATAQSGPLIRVTDFRNDPAFSGMDGNGYAAVILDTGITLNHPFFGPDLDGNGVADRIVYQHDFADNDNDASDADGHGTNVSSIVASQDPVYPGMAPGVKIILLKVFKDADGTGDFSYVEQALQWVISHAVEYNIASVNMSFGDEGNYTQAGSMEGIGDELAALAAMNIIVASASGNDFFKLSSVQGVSYPASDPNSLSVGATYDANIGSVSYGGSAIAYSTAPDRITPFSQRHATLTSILAPGAAITGAGRSGGTSTMHGTSQATPHVSGVAVLAQQLAQRELGRRLTPQEFKGLLRSTGGAITDGDDEDDNVVHTALQFPRVDVLEMAKAIVKMDKESMQVVTVESGKVTDGVDFANQSPAIDLFIQNFYLSLLDRNPEPAAVDAWRLGYYNYGLHLGLNPRIIALEMARIFFTSQEYTARQVDNERFIRDCYRGFLFRDPSDRELLAWLGGQWARMQAMWIFARSAEFSLLMDSLVPNAAGEPARNFTATIYSGMLDRLVDAGGLAYWSTIIEQASDKKAVARDFIHQVLHSAEFLAKNPSHSALVTGFYRALLNRYPSDGEVLYWTGVLDSGAQTPDSVADFFVDSPEFDIVLAAFFP